MDQPVKKCRLTRMACEWRWSWIDAAFYDNEDLLQPWKKVPGQRNPEVDVESAFEVGLHPQWTDSSDNHKSMR
jgi:hypothetical protein